MIAGEIVIFYEEAAPPRERISEKERERAIQPREILRQRKIRAKRDIARDTIFLFYSLYSCALSIETHFMYSKQRDFRCVRSVQSKLI